MEISVDSLRECPLFSDFDNAELVQILDKMKRQDLSENDYLFHENEPGNELCIVIKGKLLVFTKSKSGEHIIGHVRPGESVGELSLLSNEPRSASVRAVCQTTIMSLTREDFQSVCFKNPKILWKLSSVIASRSQSNISMIRGDKKNKSQVIGIVFVGNIDLTDTVLELSRNNSARYKINFVDYHAVKKTKKILLQAAEHGHTAIFCIHSSEFEKEHDILNLLDRIIFAIDVDNNNISDLKNEIQELSFTNRQYLEKELILLHNSYKTSYPGTQQYLELDNFTKNYHISMKAPDSVQRMLRLISGNGIGLVISGGGAKGWAALGAIDALNEHKINIDYVGGSSIGGCVAAIFSLYEESQRSAALRKFGNLAEAELTFSFTKVTFPLLSLFNGKIENLIAKEFCGEVMIQDLSIPFFTISANLSTNSVYVWEKDYVRQAFRATAAVPVMMPPLVYENQVHVDGGIINNFPIEVMRSKLDHRGTIIGINIGASSIDPKKYNAPPEIGFWEALRIKLHMQDTTYMGLAEIMDRIIMTASIETTKKNEKLCDLLISPEIRAYGLFDFEKREDLYAEGYRAACEALKNWTPP